MPIYCPTCNRSSDDCQFIGEFCEFCLGDKEKRKMPKQIKVFQCRLCSRLKVGQTYMETGNEKRVLGRAINHEIGSQYEVGVLDFGRNNVARCMITRKTDDGDIKFEAEFDIKQLHETCQRCFRISAGYYQGIVQLRGNREKMDRLMAKLSRYLERRKSYITKVEDVSNGIDIYVSNKEETNNFFMAHDLKPLRSYRLWGMKMGKKVNRNTYSLHVD
jgi:nonsense-mediated mRNA decay protein 3